MLADASALPRVEKAMGRRVKLHAVSDDFGQEFTHGVQERNGAVCLGDRVIQLVGLWNDDTLR